MEAPEGKTWIDHVDPDAVILTAGEGNRHGHPHSAAMDTYEGHVGQNRVYCTSGMGTIRVYGRRDGKVRGLEAVSRVYRELSVLGARLLRVRCWRYQDPTPDGV